MSATPAFERWRQEVQDLTQLQRVSQSGIRVYICIWCIYYMILSQKTKTKQKIILQTFALIHSVTIPFIYIIHSGHTQPWTLSSPPTLTNAPSSHHVPTPLSCLFIIALWPLGLTRAAHLGTGSALPPKARLTRRQALTLQCLLFTIRTPKRTSGQGLLKAGLLALPSLQFLSPSTTFSYACPHSRWGCLAVSASFTWHAFAWRLGDLSLCELISVPNGPWAVLPTPDSCKTRKRPPASSASLTHFLYEVSLRQRIPAAHSLVPARTPCSFFLGFLGFAHTIPSALKCELSKGSDSHESCLHRQFRHLLTQQSF